MKAGWLGMLCLLKSEMFLINSFSRKEIYRHSTIHFAAEYKRQKIRAWFLCFWHLFGNLMVFFSLDNAEIIRELPAGLTSSLFENDFLLVLIFWWRYSSLQGPNTKSFLYSTKEKVFYYTPPSLIINAPGCAKLCWFDLYKLRIMFWWFGFVVKWSNTSWFPVFSSL